MRMDDVFGIGTAGGLSCRLWSLVAVAGKSSGETLLEIHVFQVRFFFLFMFS